MRALTSVTEKLLSPVGVRSSDRLDLSLTRDGGWYLAHIYSRQPNSLYPEKNFPASDAAQHLFVERVCERKKVDSKEYPCSWQFAATDVTTAVINANWKEPRLRFLDPNAKALYQYRLLGAYSQDRAAEIVARYRETGEVPTNGLALREDLPLSDYQIIGAHATQQLESYGLFMEQGTGKTPVMIAVICNEAERHFKQHGRPYRAIVVCPRNVRANWANEFSRFATTKGKVVVMRGDRFERIKLFIDALESAPGDRFTVVVMSYEAMVRMMEFLKTVKWDRGILDEAHYIKNPSSKRAHAAMQLRDCCARRNVLTGTPVCNSVLDIYSQLSFLNIGGSGFITWKSFRKFYGVWDNTADYAGHEKLVAIQNLPFMRERLAKSAYIVRKKDVLNLPDKLYSLREVSMGVEQEAAYRDLRVNLIHECQSQLESGGNRTLLVNNVLTKLLRLSQVTSGFLQFPEEFDDVGNVTARRETVFFNPNPKLDELVKLLSEQDPDCKTIIWAHWVADIEAIAARLTELNIEYVTYYGDTSDNARVAAERRFNFDRRCGVLIGSAGAGGTGLNLLGHPPGPEGDAYSTDCRLVVYYSQDWSHPKRSQSEDRPHRRGTRQPVSVVDLCVPNTIDEEIRLRVTNKRFAAFEVSDIQKILVAMLHGVLHDDG